MSHEYSIPARIDKGWLPRWLVPLLTVLFLLSTVGAIGGGWYIAHRLDVNEVNDD